MIHKVVPMIHKVVPPIDLEGPKPFKYLGLQALSLCPPLAIGLAKKSWKQALISAAVCTIPIVGAPFEIIRAARLAAKTQKDEMGEPVAPESPQEPPQSDCPGRSGIPNC